MRLSTEIVLPMSGFKPVVDQASPWTAKLPDQPCGHLQYLGGSKFSNKID